MLEGVPFKPRVTPAAYVFFFQQQYSIIIFKSIIIEIVIKIAISINKKIFNG